MVFVAGGNTLAYERMRIDGSTGRVGIGTNSPGYLLDVNGGGHFSGDVGIGTTPASGYALTVSGNEKLSGHLDVVWTGTVDPDSTASMIAVGHISDGGSSASLDGIGGRGAGSGDTWAFGWDASTGYSVALQVGNGSGTNSLTEIMRWRQAGIYVSRDILPATGTINLGTDMNPFDVGFFNDIYYSTGDELRDLFFQQYSDRLHVGTTGSSGPYIEFIHGTYAGRLVYTLDGLTCTSGFGFNCYGLQVWGDALVQGPSGFDANNETAYLYIGDVNNYIKAVYGGDTLLATWSRFSFYLSATGTPGTLAFDIDATGVKTYQNFYMDNGTDFYHADSSFVIKVMGTEEAVQVYANNSTTYSAGLILGNPSGYRGGLTLQRKSTSSTMAGTLCFVSADGATNYVWADNSDQLRI